MLTFFGILPKQVFSISASPEMTQTLCYILVHKYITCQVVHRTFTGALNPLTIFLKTNFKVDWIN